MQRKSKDAASIILGFSDIPNWRNRELAGESPTYGQKAAPTRQQILDFPESMNVEDRRNESVFRPDVLAPLITGLSLDDLKKLFSSDTWKQAWTTPYTPSFNSLHTLITNDPLAQQVGYQDIPVYPQR